MDIRFHYEKPIEEVGILTPSTGKLWFEELVGGLLEIEKKDLPDGTVFGYEMASFVINVQMYLPWLVGYHCSTLRVALLLIRPRLQTEATRLGIEIHRRVFDHINEALELYPETTAVFHCTGLGALILGGVEDKSMYSARVNILRPYVWEP